MKAFRVCGVNWFMNGEGVAQLGCENGRLFRVSRVNFLLLPCEGQWAGSLLGF